jgi:hypothetical protein
MTATTFAANLYRVERLCTGKVQRINAGSRTYRLPLTGLAAALVMRRACVAKHRSA